MNDFGVVICCCRFDFFLAKACVASVRRAMGDVPITLFMDDDFDATELAEAYNLSLMRRSELKDPFLREHNRGWGLPKISLFWVSPYERYLYLDCDTIVWGDVRTHLQGDWDMVIDTGDANSRPWTPDVGTKTWTNKEYFNTDLMEQVFPNFPWQKYQSAYFCTGCYASRKNVFTLDEYKSLVETMKLHPKLFPVGEMGFLNYMIFDAVERGRLHVERRPITIMAHFDSADRLPQRFVIGPDGPVVRPDDVTILHFTDPKPMTSSTGFHAPFDYFRKQVVRRLGGIGRLWPGLYIRLQELEWRLTIWWRRSRYARFHGYVRPLLFWKRQGGRP